MIFVDADACPVRDETLRVAERHGVSVLYVTNGGIRPVRHPLATVQVVPTEPDAADRWIAERIGPGDVCVTADVPLASRCVERGARAVAPNGTVTTSANAGAQLASRNLMADLRAADPFRQGGRSPFSRADRSRFLDVLDRLLRRP